MNSLDTATRTWMKTSWNGHVAMTPMEETQKAVVPPRATPDGPYIFPWHVPHGARCHANVRIDADWCKREEWTETMRMLEPIGKHASWFITTSKVADSELDLLEDLKRSGVEIGSHMHYHFTFRDYKNNIHNMKLAHAWLTEHSIECTSFVSPSAKWNENVQRCVQEMNYVYSSEFGLAHDCHPFVTRSGALQLPVHAVSPINFAEKDKAHEYYEALVDALYESCLPIHLYAHPHDMKYMGRAVVEKVAQMKDVHISTLLEYATWWKNRTFAYDLKRDEQNDTWTVTWNGSEGVWLAVSWDNVHFSLVEASSATFKNGELPPGKHLTAQPFAFFQRTPLKRSINWRSKVGEWLDLEYVVPPKDYRISSLKTAVNYLLKLRRA